MFDSQRNFLFEVLTVHEYMYLIGRIQKDSEQSDVVFKNVVDRLLASLMLRDSEHKLAKDLNKVEQVKMSIAFALLGRSNVLLFDNPTHGFSLDEKRELWNLLVNLPKQRAVFITSNSLEEVDVSL